MQKMINNKEMETKPFYDSETVIIFLENNKYIFEAGKGFVSDDIMESVIFILKNCNVNDNFWKIKISRTSINNIDFKKSLYWISGGDEFWNDWMLCWHEYCDIYADEYSEELKTALKKTKNLGDIRNMIINIFNLDRMYEFALKLNLKKSS